MRSSSRGADFSQGRPRALSHAGLAGAILTGALFLCLLSQKIYLPSADLGRHLKNGEITAQTGVIPNRNLFSYTHPAFPFNNHHWGAGLIFYATHRAAGFRGLSLLFLGLSLGALLLVFDLARHYAGAEVSSLAVLPFLPLIASRGEIRPEVFTYLFSAYFLWVLVGFREGRLGFRLLWTLPIVQVLWVNTHVYFFLGPFLALVFSAESGLIGLRNGGAVMKRGAAFMAVIAAALFAACLINPLGWEGAAYPAFIFRDFGYRLFENQSVGFLGRLVFYPPSRSFKIALAILSVSWAAAIWRRNISSSRAVLSVLIGVLGWSAVRNFALFGYWSIFLTAGNLHTPAGSSPHPLSEAMGQFRRWFFPAFVSACALLYASNPIFFKQRWPPGFGLAPGSDNAARFFLDNAIEGPLFNNYDIGGYLIGSLYPKERVFVDNRPEAYPASFFADIYVPMQEREERWHQEDARWGFNSIFFYRHDATPWGQDFLIRRVVDPAWAPVYVDAYCLILLKRNERNARLIQKFELPQGMFSVQKTSLRYE